jgi:hypothetical protein
MIKNIVQPFVSSLINELTPAGEGETYFGGGFANSMSSSSLIDSVTIFSGSANVYGQLYSGYGRGMYNYVYGSSRSSSNTVIIDNDLTMANGDTHPIWGVYQHNNKLWLRLGTNASSATYLGTTSVVPNTDTDAFKTLKIVDPASDAVLLEVDRADFNFQNMNSGYTYYNGSLQAVYFPSWQQPSAAVGNFFGGHGVSHQTRRIELWS